MKKFETCTVISKDGFGHFHLHSHKGSEDVSAFWWVDPATTDIYDCTLLYGLEDLRAMYRAPTAAAIKDFVEANGCRVIGHE